MMRIVVLVFTAIVTLFAMNTEASIYKMVENATKVTLDFAAFVPSPSACIETCDSTRCTIVNYIWV